jgi:3-hydroxyacyl-[acyl-carrier-protein] dehydratase
MIVGDITISPDHPSLPGHFPGRPIVPGVVLLDEALALIGKHYAATPISLRVKFTAVVLGGQTITLSTTSPSAGALSFTAQRDGDTVMSGTLRLDPPG